MVAPYNLEDKAKVQGASPENHLEVIIAKKFAEKAKNATNKGQDFNISYQEFSDMIKSAVCHYTGKKIFNLEQASIERINPLKGYIPGNVCMVDADVNKFKGSTIDSFLRTRFNNNIPNCLSEILNICNKMALNLGLTVNYNSTTGFFKVLTPKMINDSENAKLLSQAKSHRDGFFGKHTIVRIESKRSKYFGKPAVILKTYSKDGVADEYKVKLLTDGCPKIKVKQVSLMDLR